MATVKLTAEERFVILKNNRVSCDCSCCVGNFSITDLNVFQITKSEYIEYYNGGIWTISVNEFLYELGRACFAPDLYAELLYGNVSYSKESDWGVSSGCSQSYGFIQAAPRTIVIGDNPPLTELDTQWSCYLDVYLKEQNNNYYVKFDLFSSIAGTGNSVYYGIGKPLPPNCEWESPFGSGNYTFNSANHSVNGNSLKSCITPSADLFGRGIAGCTIFFNPALYSNSSTSQISLTFNPT